VRWIVNFLKVGASTPKEKTCQTVEDKHYGRKISIKVNLLLPVPTQETGSDVYKSVSETVPSTLNISNQDNTTDRNFTTVLYHHSHCVVLVQFNVDFPSHPLWCSSDQHYIYL
jgi:hypothetical protein